MSEWGSKSVSCCGSAPATIRKSAVAVESSTTNARPEQTYTQMLDEIRDRLDQAAGILSEVAGHRVYEQPDTHEPNGILDVVSLKMMDIDRLSVIILDLSQRIIHRL